MSEEHEVVTLGSLKPGENGIIKSLRCIGLIRRRFLDIGLVPGTKIRVVLESFGGDPVAYRIKDTHIAIRNKDAESIIIERV